MLVPVARSKGEADVAGMNTQTQTVTDGLLAPSDHDVAAREVQTRQVIVVVVGRDDGLDDDAGILGEGSRQVQPCQGLLERAAREHATAVHHHQMIGQARDLVRGVADVEHRDRQLVVQPLQVGQDLLLARDVQGGKRLVHQQHPRADRQGAGDGDPLALAAGEAIRLARRAGDRSPGARSPARD